ncbi:MAG: GMC oxidoreductase, partial [Acidimicrobiia bacterium]
HMPRAAAVALAGTDAAVQLYSGGIRPLPDDLLPKRGLLGALTLDEDVRRAEHLPGAALSFNSWTSRQDEHASVTSPGDVASVLDDAGSPVPVAAMDVFLRSEQVPDPENRVTLTDEVDALGVPLVHLNWDVTAVDLDCIRRTLAIVAPRLGLGGSRLQLDPAVGSPAGAISGGSHHMGTTRMNDDPHLGVVDAECRVHGVANLYVAGSAVFPTGGYANPTLTLVALTLRLADELRRRLVSP